MKPLDKKQIPQVIVLAVLAVAFFAYFAMKLILPTPAAARTAPIGAAAGAPAPAPGAPAAATPVAADAGLTAPPPGPGMRDPFVPGITDPATVPVPTAPAVHTASLKGPSVSRPLGVTPLPLPSMQPLPSVGSAVPASSVKGLAPMPVALPPPAWIVTGVLQSGMEHIAVLRNGEARRFVKQGEFVDSEYKVVKVTREIVILGHGAVRFVLPLGGEKAAPAKPAGVLPSARPLPAVPAAAPKPDTISRTVTPVLAVRRHTVVATRRIAYPKIAKARPRLTTLHPVVRVADYLSTALPSYAPSVSPRGMLPIGTLAPDFSLSTINGQSLTLSQFTGRPVLLNFWASWDVQSTHMMSSLASLQGQFRDQGLTVLSVNTWDNEDALRTFLNGKSFGGVVMLIDPSVSNDSLAVRLYKVPDVPALYLIDSQGRIAAAFVGHGRNTTSAIKDALAKIGVQ